MLPIHVFVAQHINKNILTQNVRFEGPQDLLRTPLDHTVPPEVAPYVVAFHRNDAVKLPVIGFVDKESARAVYDMISDDWAKVLSDRALSRVRCLTLYTTKWY